MTQSAAFEAFDALPEFAKAKAIKDGDYPHWCVIERVDPIKDDRREPLVDDQRFVVAIVGLTPGELGKRQDDLATMLERLGRPADKPVTLMLYDLKIEKSSLCQPIRLRGVEDEVAVVAVHAPSPSPPSLPAALKAVQSVAGWETYVGHTVDVALSDWSSPAWDVSPLTKHLAQSLKGSGGRIFVMLEDPRIVRQTTLSLPGGRYFQGLPEPRGRMASILKVHSGGELNRFNGMLTWMLPHPADKHSRPVDLVTRSIMD